MPYPQKHPLRPLTEQEERALSRTAKASSERVDTVRRAKALLAVKAGEPFTQAARRSGFKSADSVSQLVQRFNQQGLAALFIAAGRGRKATYTSRLRFHMTSASRMRGTERPSWRTSSIGWSITKRW